MPENNQPQPNDSLFKPYTKARTWVVNYYFCHYSKQYYWILTDKIFRPACICEMRTMARGCKKIGQPLKKRSYFLNLIIESTELRAKLLPYLNAGDFTYYDCGPKIKILLDFKHIAPTKAMLENLLHD